MEKSNHFFDFLPKGVFCASLAIGFAGSFCSMFLQTTGIYRDYNILWLAVMLVPFLVVQIYAKGTFIERLGKIWIGSFVVFIVAMVPGGALGIFLRGHFQ